MSANRHATVSIHLPVTDDGPSNYGVGKRFWENTSFAGETENWEGTGHHGGAPAIQHDRWYEHSLSEPGGSIVSFIEREMDEAFYLLYRIVALPPDDFGLEYAIAGELVGSDLYAHIGPTAIETNPGVSISFTGIPAQDYVQDPAPEPSAALAQLTGPSALEDPKLGQLLLSELPWQEDGQLPLSPFAVEFHGLGDVVRDAAADVGLPLLLGIRAWVDPMDLERAVSVDEGSAFVSGSAFTFTMLSPGTGENNPIDRDRALPILVQRMICPDDEDQDEDDEFPEEEPIDRYRDRPPSSYLDALAWRLSRSTPVIRAPMRQRPE